MAAALSESVDVVVVGAGISGLSAAYELMKKRPETRLVVQLFLAPKSFPVFAL